MEDSGEPSRWLRLVEGRQPREALEVDPVREGERYRLSAEVLREIWRLVVRGATDRGGRCDRAAALQQFHERAARFSTGGAAVGRRTQVERVYGGRKAAPAGRVPGRRTRVEMELGAVDQVAPLEASVRGAVEATTGVALGDVRVEQDAALPAGRLGEARGDVIRLAAGLPGVDDPMGRKVRIHEAIHIAQGRITDAVVPGDRTTAVEAEAHAVAEAVERGERRSLGVRAEAGRAYAFELNDIAGALPVDPMAFVRAQLPQVAAFFERGFAPLLQQIGDAAAAPLAGALGGLDTEGFGGGIGDLIAAFSPANLARGFDTGCCECLDRALAGLLGSVQGALHSDTARSIAGLLASIQDAQTHVLIDGVADFFAALRRFGAPVLAVIDQIGALIDRADAALGGSVLWRAIAPLFGLDPSMRPIAAIQHKLAALWEGVKASVEALKQRLAALWAALRANPAIAAAIELARDMGTLLAAIQSVRDAKSRDPQVWLGILARELKGTVFESLVARLQGGYDGVLGFRDRAVAWLTGALDDLGLLAAWNAGVPYLNAIGRAVQSFARSVQHAFASIAGALERALTGAATDLRAIWQLVEPYASFVVGLGAAIARTATGDLTAIPRFVAGELWLHALPRCYQESLTNFLLDVFVAVVEWFPAVHPVIVMARSAALAFARAVRSADSALKLRAMDTIAKVMANHVDVLAGFFVGIVRGLWTSSLGFIAQMIVLPFELAWGVLSSIGSSVAGLAGTAFRTVFAGATWLVEHMAGAQPIAASPGSAPDEPAIPAPQTSTVEVESSTPVLGTEDTADSEIRSGPAQDRAPDVASSEPAAGPPAPGPAAGEDPVFEEAPAFPSLPPLRDLLDDLFKHGVSREQIEQAFHKLGLAAETWGERFGVESAARLVPALTAASAPYDVGVVLGEVVGWLAGEIITLVATQGIENAIAKLVEGAMEGARILARIGEYFPVLVAWLADMRALIAPMVEAVEHIAARAKQVLQQIMKWLEDMLVWARRQWARLLVWLETTLGAAGRGIRKRLGNLVKAEGAIEAEAEALAAANVAFEEIDAGLVREAVPHQAIEARLRTVRVPHTPDVAIRLHLVTTTHWRIEATAQKASHRGVGVSLGRGAVLFAHETMQPYYTASGHAVRHNELLELAWLELDREAVLASEAPGAHTLEGDYERVQALARRVAQRYDDMLPLRGSTHFLIKLEPLNSRDVQQDGISQTEFIITPNAATRRRPVHIRAVKAAFGAVAAGIGFRGSFDTSKVVGGTAWNYDDYPSGGLTRHPGNSFLGYSNSGRIGSLKPPAVDYAFVGGIDTPGGPSGPLERWRAHVLDSMEIAKRNLMAQGEEEDDAEEQAMQQVIDHYRKQGYPGLDWDDLLLQGANQWQAHHIHEHSWGGDEAPGNMQYLKRPGEHQRLTNWWNARRDAIRAGLR